MYTANRPLVWQRTDRTLGGKRRNDPTIRLARGRQRRIVTTKGSPSTATDVHHGGDPGRCKCGILSLKKK